MNGAWLEIARMPTREEVDDLALVLEAAGVPSGSMRHGSEHLLLVRPSDAERALAEIVRYTAETRERRDRHATPAPTYPVARGRDAAIVYAAVLVAFYVAQRTHSYGLDWYAAGTADAALIRGGAWWRSITALALHADGLHLAGNVVFGGLFAVMLAQSIGYGWTWLAFVVTGGLGNAVNALAQGRPHIAVGASTAVFGALGAQVAYEWMRRRQLRHGPLRRFAPVVIGLALLAWLGGGGAGAPIEDPVLASRKVDVGAHLFGFATGALLGFLLGLPSGAPFPPPRTQLPAAIAAGALLLTAWFLAFGR